MYLSAPFISIPLSMQMFYKSFPEFAKKMKFGYV